MGGSIYSNNGEKCRTCGRKLITKLSFRTGKRIFICRKCGYEGFCVKVGK